MGKARNIADLLDANGDVKSASLDNVPASNNASALTTGTLPIARIADDAVTADKLANSINTDIATGVAALPKAGGTMTGTIVSNVTGDSNGSKGLEINTSGTNFESDDGIIQVTHAGSGSTTGGYFMKLSTGGTDKFTIRGNGNVGIGTTPESWNSAYTSVDIGTMGSLAAYKAATSGGSVWLNRNSYYDGSHKYRNTDEASQIDQTGAGTIKFNVAPSGTAGSGISWTTAMTIDNDGKVGIGTTSPTEPLQVHGAIRSTNNATTTLADSGNFYYIPTADDGSNPRTVISGVGTSSVGGHVTFKTGTSGSNTEKMRITSGGNVGIGTASPAATLDVSGTFKTLKSHPEVLTATCTGDFVNGCSVNTWHTIEFSGYQNLSGYLGGYSQGNKGFHFELFWTGGSTASGYNHSVVGWVPPRSCNTADSYRNGGNSSYITYNIGSTSYQGVPITVAHHTSVTGSSDIRIRLVALSAGGWLKMQVRSDTSPNSANAKITIWRA